MTAGTTLGRSFAIAFIRAYPRSNKLLPVSSVMEFPSNHLYCNLNTGVIVLKNVFKREKEIVD